LSVIHFLGELTDKIGDLECKIKTVLHCIENDLPIPPESHKRKVGSSPYISPSFGANSFGTPSPALKRVKKELSELNDGSSVTSSADSNSSNGFDE
jgi:hypothetical protein